MWNHAALDSGLSAKAKGILWYLLTRPEDWDVYENDIIAHMKEGQWSIRAGIKELLGAGYMTRERVFRANGQFDGWRYDVFHFPVSRGFVVVDGGVPARSETEEQLKTLADLAAIERAECASGSR